VQEWIAVAGAKTAYIERGSPWENGYIESFNARLRDELLDGEIFYTLREAQIVIESWRRHYNTIRPHASLGYKPPAPQVFVPAFAAWPAALRHPAPPATLAQQPALKHSTWITQWGLITRLTAQWLSERLGQQFIVENRPGGGGNIGIEAVVRAPADG